MSRGSPTPDSRDFRAAAYRAASGIRAAEALLAERRAGAVFTSDRTAWADLRDAGDRLAALLAAAPDPADLETGIGPTGGAPPRIASHRRGIDASGQARAAAGMDPGDAPAGRHAPEREEAA